VEARGTKPLARQTGNANETMALKVTERSGQAAGLAKKIYLRINQFVGGWESLPTTFWAIVPASP
jgi:hypothetical protein